MKPDLRVALFVFVVGYVFATALNFFLVGLYHRLRKDSPPRTRAYLITSRTFMLLAVIGCACLLYGRYVEPRWLEVTYSQIHSPKIDKQSGKVRIVHISDIHSLGPGGIEPQLPPLIAAQKPDFIVYTGDSVNDHRGLPPFQELMKALTAIAPVYAVYGNWDVASDVRESLFTGTNVNLLDGANASLDVRGTRIWLAGSGQWHDDKIWPSTRGIPRTDFSIFLYHSPDGIHDQAAQRFDLYCAGHTHGGQVALPFYGALTTNSSYDKRFEAGLYKEKNTWLYVTRGIGMTRGAPQFRFWARPEITVIDLVPAS